MEFHQTLLMNTVSMVSSNPQPFSFMRVLYPIGQVVDLTCFQQHILFDNKDNFVGSFWYSIYKFEQANDEFDQTRRFETSHTCCDEERFQMFITTPIGATSTNFVVKRDLQDFGSTCGPLRKSFGDMVWKITLPHLKNRSIASDVVTEFEFFLDFWRDIMPFCKNKVRKH